MIGGQDILIPCSEPKVALDLATRAVMRRWRDCLIEDGDTGEELQQYSQMEFAELSEILISKTAEASKMWDQIGACDATNGTLIQLLAGRTTLTVVIDDEPTDEMRSIVREIRQALIQDLFASRAAMEKVA
jgi:hypothetical protein